jgi:hypothetical protein
MDAAPQSFSQNPEHLDHRRPEPQDPPGDQEGFVVSSYPPNSEQTVVDEAESEIEDFVQAVREHMSQQPPQSDPPLGYVSNARNAAASSDTFQFWAPADECSLGIGSITHHMSSARQVVHTYGVIVDAEGAVLGLEDFATDVFEKGTRPPHTSITPAPSNRRPVVNYSTKVLASTQKMQRPVLSGPVYAVEAGELADLYGKGASSWLDPDYLLTGFYEDTDGAFGLFAEERARVLGPKQGHVILSGLPGAGKTSLFLTLIISLYAQLRDLEKGSTDGEDTCS